MLGAVLGGPHPNDVSAPHQAPCVTPNLQMKHLRHRGVFEGEEAGFWFIHFADFPSSYYCTRAAQFVDNIGIKMIWETLNDDYTTSFS